MDFWRDMLHELGEVVTLMPLLLVLTLWMGRRSVAELPVFDFLVVVTLGAVVATAVVDPELPRLTTYVSMVAICLLQITVSWVAIRIRRIGSLITFEPTVVVRDGVFLDHNIRRLRYSVDNILQMLREYEVFDVRDVDMAILEGSGRLTVLRKPGKEFVTREDMGITKRSAGIAYPVVIEGKIYADVLEQLGVTAPWLRERLQQHGVRELRDVYFASLNAAHELHISKRQEQLPDAPRLHH